MHIVNFGEDIIFTVTEHGLQSDHQFGLWQKQLTAIYECIFVLTRI